MERKTTVIAPEELERQFSYCERIAAITQKCLVKHFVINIHFLQFLSQNLRSF